MSDIPTPPPVAGSRRLTRVALALSLLANLVIVGLVLGAVISHRGGPDRGLSDMGLGPFFQALPPEARDEIRDTLSTRKDELRQNRSALRRDFQAMLAVLRADPYDEAKLREAVSAQQVRLQERQEIARTALFERIAQMSPQERSAFADALEEAVRRGPHRRDRGDEGKTDR